MVTVAASGYFDPIHKGHIEYLKMARALGDELIVILNSDVQCKIKKGKSFMDENERKIILESIRYVDKVFLSCDEDGSVCKSLSVVKPDIFAKGGDRFSTEIPEKEICDKLNIVIMDGLGNKIQSSSNLTGLK
jgi:cytidyltransferase-like protein